MQFDGINIDKIPMGLELNCKVYFERNSKYFFLCECDTVTPEIIDRFKKAVNPDNMVYISANYLKAFYEKGIDLGWTPPEKDEDDAEDYEETEISEKLSEKDELIQKQYNEAKIQSEELFTSIAKDNKLDIERTEYFAADICRRLETTDVSSILQSINGIRNIDEYLHTHSLNVAFLNGMVASWLGYDKESHDRLVKIGLLHDIGKLRVPDKILNKPAKLTAAEFEEIKKHSQHSFEMLVESGIKDKKVLLGVLQHHEKLNGMGYPHGIGADKITEFARITSISDIYDAMVAKRVYKDANSPFKILDTFSKDGYSELDIGYVKIFIECMVEELKGKRILLSDNSVATVVMVNEKNLNFPLIKHKGKIVPTTSELYCVSMYNTNISSEEIEKAYGEGL